MESMMRRNLATLALLREASPFAASGDTTDESCRYQAEEDAARQRELELEAEDIDDHGERVHARMGYKL
jgi:hypothetical protein